MRFLFIRLTQNKKTGKIPITSSPPETCPHTCPLSSGDCLCYAKYGHLNIWWDRLDNGSIGVNFYEMCEAIRNLPSGTMLADAIPVLYREWGGKEFICKIALFLVHVTQKLKV